MKRDELFWSAPVEALKRGHMRGEGGAHICLICGERFDDGTIYPSGGALYTAAKAICLHVRDAHGGMFEYLLGSNREYTGLTDHQAQLLTLFYQGLSDREVLAQTSATSTSTIRNQRFALREKHKQAKVVCALMDLFEERLEGIKLGKPDKGEDLVQIHRTATMIDVRYAITEAEKADVLGRYFDADGNLLIKTFPAREKRKIIILQTIAERFEPGARYTEKQINEAISRYYSDVATVRRYLIEYGFLERERDGSAYWLKV